ncbi:hypothetical protein [Flavobacterium sp. NKUCC04_CG]|uniref:hypothetical protein n=1 Tax=Flavobacterium sp. NKUCC04_CG TaxID=2842121 RepID=UPI001C5AC34B|nr:hypothetical protein [Flavobacterium sp. NKUCC04_CG]MBW3520272.1 hypothetical protein [Flavobacterium sp. NKUCC04_CG]
MENPFKKILYDEKLPEVIRDRVTDNIALIKLSLEVAELFTIKLPNVMATLIKDNHITTTNAKDKFNQAKDE